MAIFNPQYLTNPVASLNTAFGIPTCMLNFGVEALSLIDTGVLTQMAEMAEQGKASARAAISGVVNNLFSDMGLLSYDAGTGKFTLFSEASKFGLDLGFLDKVAQVTGYLSEIESFVNQGIDVYNEISNCISEVENWLNSTGPAPITGTGGLGGGSSDQYTENARAAALGLAKARVNQATEFADKCNELLQNIGTVLLEREQQPAEAEDDLPIFRLVYGPPVSRQGVFILSEDGLYYDSQDRMYNGKPIPSASDVGFVVDSEKWTMDHAPSLGGKGTIVSVDQLNQYVDTIFDPNNIDDSKTLTEYYDADHFLNVLEGQKAKRVEDITSEITELKNGGYVEDSALVVNYRQNLYSVADSFNRQIDKRKKQIEVAVKSADLFGSDEVFLPGEIPVNNFSFLSSINLSVALEKQEALTFEAGDVEDVVLPIEPVFVTNYGSTSEVVISPLVVPPVGQGSIVFSPSVSSTTAPAISLTDQIEADSLFAIYNFLKPSVQSVGSNVYDTLNCATVDTYGNAQTIGKTTAGVFASGLAIPKFTGVSKFNAGTKKLTNTGNYLRLPPIDEFQNLLYSSRGCSLECWLHIPNYGTDQTSREKDAGNAFRPNTAGAWGDYNYYKVLLGNENLGGTAPVPDVSSLSNAGGSNTTKGLLIGFTRDPVIYRDDFVIPGPNTDPGKNVGVAASSTVASSCFFIAPTMAFDGSSVEFKPNSDCANSTSINYNKMIVKDDYTVGGSKMSDVSAGFVHLHISFDVSGDNCSIYLDGNLMATSAMTQVFGGDSGKSPSIPTFIRPEDQQNSSFYYSSETVVQNDNVEIFNNGPLNDTYFTPWIVGGGWTEGHPINRTTLDGGFMGLRHGLTSGLNGFVGSLKFYSKPLTSSEVVKNYNAQKGLFKNIQT